MKLRRSGTLFLCTIAVLLTACGGVAQSVPPTTTLPVASGSLLKVIKVGRLAFKVPLSWAVGYGTCQCAWGVPNTATLDNGPQEGEVACSCPEERDDAPPGLHLYEGESGLISGGRPMVINGLQARVSLDASNATMIATFPGANQWITISPGPRSASASTRLHQVAIEREILATFTVNPSGSQ